MSEVYNDDIAGIYRRINRYIEELQKSASSNVADVNEFDKARLQEYLANITFFVDWVTSQPKLDLPETHPKTIALEPAPSIILTENLMIKDLVRLLERGRDELVNSQSARNASSLISFDEQRFRSVIAKANKYLTDYVEKVIPLDLPESTPAQPSTGSGRTGLNP